MRTVYLEDNIFLYNFSECGVTQALAKQMQQHLTLLNSTFLDDVGLHGPINASCCTVETQIVQISDLGLIMIPNLRQNYSLPMPEGWFAVCM